MSHQQRLQGKTALVTGGSRGIGAAIAKRLAEDGAKVAITYSASPDAANAVVAEIKSKGGDAVAFKANAANAREAANAVTQAAQHLGRLDILVNNAGVFEGKPVAETTDADYDRSFDINVRAVFATVREAANLLPEGGRIINIGSVLGQRVGFPGVALYAATKFAVQGFTRGWAREFAPRKITVNVVQPGPINTDMNPDNTDFAKVQAAMTALGRYGSTEDIASAVAFLASPEASYITGEMLNVDGGMEA
jgi:3-oxoacyl-[acyl-carrier protein] reductase